MNCPKCGYEQNDHNMECINCGIIFSKYGKSSVSRNQFNSVYGKKPAGLSKILKNLFFYAAPETNPIIFGSRIIFYIIVVAWGLKFIFSPMGSNYTGESFWHLVNLPFHEAGHIFSRPFGRFVTSLGGTLGQLLMPFICFIVFLVKTRDAFAASFCLWWLGENFMDIAPYINDARSLTLPLLGGNTGRTSPYGFHDWEFILKESHLISYDHVFAKLSYATGTVLMLIAFAWGGYILFKQYKNLTLK